MCAQILVPNNEVIFAPLLLPHSVRMNFCPVCKRELFHQMRRGIPYVDGDYLVCPKGCVEYFIVDSY